MRRERRDRGRALGSTPPSPHATLRSGRERCWAITRRDRAPPDGPARTTRPRSLEHFELDASSAQRPGASARAARDARRLARARAASGRRVERGGRRRLSIRRRRAREHLVLVEVDAHGAPPRASSSSLTIIWATRSCVCTSATPSCCPTAPNARAPRRPHARSRRTRAAVRPRALCGNGSPPDLEFVDHRRSVSGSCAAASAASAAILASCSRWPTTSTRRVDDVLGAVARRLARAPS